MEGRGAGCGGGEERGERGAPPHFGVGWLVAGLCFCFRERAVGDRALLNVRLASSGSDANVRAGRSPFEPIGMALERHAEVADEFLAKVNILAGGSRDSTPPRGSAH